VCEHFEGILKLISIEKMILCTVFSTKANSVRNSGGYLQFVSDPKELCQLLYTCCEKLVQHIVGKARPIEVGSVSPSKEDQLTKEVRVLCIHFIFGITVDKHFPELHYCSVVFLISAVVDYVAMNNYSTTYVHRKK